MSLLDAVRQTIREHDLAGPATRIVVALSGGSDSMALAHLLRELAAARELQVAGVAHFNHQLRASADAEEALVRDEAAVLGWPLLAEREDVAARAARERRSLEDAARTARHAFFARARAHFAADVVAVGHTRDDQAETFLLRLLRGAGARGLASMHPRNGIVIRPLLGCRRSALRAYLAEAHVTFAEDESNGDTSIPRNRIRAELLPLLQARFNPAIVDVLADEAEIARDTWQWIETAADVITGQPLDTSRSGNDEGSSVSLDIAALGAAPAAVRRFAVWRAMTTVSGGRPVGFGHVAAVLRLIQSGHDGRFDAPGQRVARSGDSLVLIGRPPGAIGRWSANPTNRGNPGNPTNLGNQANLFEFPLSIPGEVALPDAACVVSVELDGAGDSRAIPRSDSVALVRRELCGGHLAVRNRRPGDRFSPVGLGGRKKLQDFFVDRKIARQDRDLVPLVVDETDRIVWVAGHALDEAFRVTAPSQAVLILRIKRLGGSA